MKKSLKLPKAPDSIAKGSTLKILLDKDAVNCLTHNLSIVDKSFDKDKFRKEALASLKNFQILDRGRYLADVLYRHLPKPYSKATKIIINSLTPPLQQTEQNGLGVFFYLPHTFFVAKYGLSSEYNNKQDPFEISMSAQYELTRRFTAEFSIRDFINQYPERTLKKLREWLGDPCPHVRRLCSEGSRPRLPWATRIPKFVKDPSPTINILEALKDDPVLYVRRSVANHIGDIAKDHPELAIKICKSWLKGASEDRKWVIRHALRYLAKKNNKDALRIRSQAK